MNDARNKLKQASISLTSGDTHACQALCNEILQDQPGLPDALHMRAIAAARMGQSQQAITDLNQLRSVQAGNLHAALLLGSLLRQNERFDEAVAPLIAAQGQPLLEIDARYELARVLTRLRRLQDAVEQYRELLILKPDHADALANQAFLLERLNQLDSASVQADQALSLNPENFMAQLTRSTINRRSGHIREAQAQLEALLETEISPLNRSIVLNQLAQCLERSSAWQEAFERYQESNAILSVSHPHGRAIDSGSYGLHTISHFRRWLRANPPAQWSAPATAQISEPAFLVGFPRSGTTLLDQALSAHAGIEVMEEYEFLDQARRNWVDGNRIDSLPGMSTHELDSARLSYLQELSSHRRFEGRPVVVDKLPLNLAYLFLINRLFPSAKIILMLRDPRDACLSCFFQAFDLQGAMPYFLDLANTSQYYNQVMSLAEETRQVISNPFITVRYEELVTDFEATARQVVQFLGLEWDKGVLDYRQRSMSQLISTPSYQQVVEPLYTRSISRWKNFLPYAEPGLDSLGPWVKHFGYSAV